MVFQNRYCAAAIMMLSSPFAVTPYKLSLNNELEMRYHNYYHYELVST